VPTDSAPVVDIAPVELTVRPELGLVVTNVTGPRLPSTVIGPAVNVPDEWLETVPVTKVVCTSLVAPPDEVATGVKVTVTVVELAE
jgi:hypothetical protein